MGDVKNKVSIRRIIGNVVDKLQLEDVSSRISSMANWAVDAQLKIGSKSSYEKFECEIDVKNYRACLPAGYVHLIALKKDNDHLEVTFKDFTHFHKGSAPAKIDDPNDFNNGNKVRQAHPGVPNAHQIDLSGIFSDGDVINVTVSNDNCGNVSTNIYNYTVMPGDNLNSIVAAFVQQINTVNPPYTAVPDSTWFQIIGDTPLINMNVVVSTTSLTGNITTRVIQRRILPVEEATSDPENCEVNIKSTSSNLANKATHHLNDGMNSDSPILEGVTGNGFGHGSYTTSKYSISNGYIHFSGLKEGKVGISYMGIQLDEEGWPMIDEVHEDAVTHYLMWQSQWANFTRGKISGQAFQKLEDRWYWLCGQARGDDELPNEDELQYLANAWNQLIPLPNKNFF